MSDTPSTPPEQEPLFSPDMVLHAVCRFWWLLLLSALAGAALAFWAAGRQPFEYSKKASVMLRDTASRNPDVGDVLLHELGMESGATNLANEACILKSTALMQRAVESLGLNVQYWRDVHFRMLNIYRDTPLLVEFAAVAESLNCELEITPRSESEYQLSYVAPGGQPVNLEGTFGTPLELPFATVIVRPTAKMSSADYGYPVMVRRSPLRDTARVFLSKLVVERPAKNKDATLLELSLSGSHPAMVADVLDKLIEVYNLNSRDEKGVAARKTEAFIHERLKELGASLNEVDAQIAERREQDELVSGAENALTADFTSAQALDKEVFDLETQLKLVKALAQHLEQAGEHGGLIALDTGVAEEGVIEKIRSYNEAYLEYRRVASSAGSRNPIMVALTEKMQATLSAAKRALQNYRTNQEVRLRDLHTKRQELEQRIEKTADHERKLLPLVREHKVKEELYILLLTKEQENALALALAAPGALVLESAHGTDAPVKPNTRLLVAGGAGAGALLCLGLLVGAGMLNNKVRTRRDVANHCTLPLLGELPMLTRREFRETLAGEMTIRGQQGRMLEALHILRNNAESLIPGTPGRGMVYVMTSTLSHEGKTLVAINLASAFAMAGRRVLLMDADLRRRTLSHDCGGRGRRGLTSWLLNKVDAPEVLTHPLAGAAPGVDVMYSGSSVPNPVSLLSHPRMAELVGELRRRYDVILIDSPPYAALADTALLMPLCDAVLYLIRSGMVRKQYLHSVQQLAEQGKLPHAGLILNAVNFRTARYEGYGYGYGDNYSRSDEE